MDFNDHSCNDMYPMFETPRIRFVYVGFLFKVQRDAFSKVCGSDR
jgi:hypothetical protein